MILGRNLWLTLEGFSGHGALTGEQMCLLQRPSPAPPTSRASTGEQGAPPGCHWELAAGVGWSWGEAKAGPDAGKHAWVPHLAGISAGTLFPPYTERGMSVLFSLSAVAMKFGTRGKAWSSSLPSPCRGEHIPTHACPNCMQKQELPSILCRSPAGQCLLAPICFGTWGSLPTRHPLATALFPPDQTLED